MQSSLRLQLFDFEHMSTNNELIAQIELARSSGGDVKAIRRQKFDPNNFYMTLTEGGKQVGPVKVEGNIDQLNQKFAEAQTYLAASKSGATPMRKAA
jgi:hypothetical protein